MSNRQDARGHCPSCHSAMADGDGVFTKRGALVCRICANTELIADTDREIKASGAPAWAPDRPDSRLGYWALAPVVFFAVVSLLQLLDHLVRAAATAPAAWASC